MFRILIGILMVFVLGCGEPDPEPVPAPVDETQKEEVEPVDLCANPPPHECCASPTPECNRCRAKYEGYIRGCPGVVDKRIRVPVENEMRWAGGSLQTEDADTDPSALLESGIPDGVHFRPDSDLSGKAFLTCDELSEALCCRGDSPDCLNCRSKAQQVVTQCKMSGQRGFQILHSPVGQPGQMDDPTLPKPNGKAAKPPALQ